MSDVFFVKLKYKTLNALVINWSKEVIAYKSHSLSMPIIKTIEGCPPAAVNKELLADLLTVTVQKQSCLLFHCIENY